MCSAFALIFIPGYLSLFLADVLGFLLLVKTPWPKALERRVKAGAQGRNLRQELKQSPWNKAACLLTPPGLLSLLSFFNNLFIFIYIPVIVSLTPSHLLLTSGY